MESNRSAVVCVAPGNLFFRTELLDVIEVGGTTKEQMVDHHLTCNVFNLASTEVVRTSQSSGICIAQVRDETLPEVGLGFNAGLVKLHLI